MAALLGAKRLPRYSLDFKLKAVRLTWHPKASGRARAKG